MRTVARPDQLMPYLRWGSHQPALVRAVRAAGEGARVLELGAGDASTPLLSSLTRELRGVLVTVEHDPRFTPSQAHDHHFVCRNMEQALAHCRHYDVALVDSAPGPDRGGVVLRLHGLADVLVCHDTEPEHEAMYGWPWHILESQGYAIEHETCKWTQIRTTTARAPRALS